MPHMKSCLSFIALSGLGHLALAQDQSAQFNQVVNLNGNMQLNRITFPDNSKIETFSQTQRQLIVNQNPSSLSANHVVGSTGGPFVQLSQNSMTIATNNATDLVGAQIELPMDPAVLSQNNITADNTFVAMLSPDRQTWIVMEGVKSVNSTDSTVRMVKMSNIDGEFMAIGRQTTETSMVLNPFGGKSVNISGSGIQEAEFSDGFRMSVKATQPMTVTTNVVNGVSTSMTANGIMPVNNFRYLVTTNLAGVTPGLNQMVAVVQLPMNPARLMQMATQMGIGANGSMVLGIAQRGVIQNPGGATGSLSPQKRAAPKKASSSSSAGPSKTASKSASSPTADASTSSETSGAAGANSTSPDASGTESNSTSDASGSTPSSSGSSSPASTASSASSESSVSAAGASPSDASASAAPATQDPAAAQPQTPPSNTSPQAPAATQLLLSPTFTPVNAKIIMDQVAGRVAVPVTQLNGEFILTMGQAGASSTQQQPQPLQPAPARRRRQLSSRQNTASASQSGVVLSMTDLNAMVQRERNGGAAFLPAEMMDEFMQQNN